MCRGNRALQERPGLLVLLASLGPAGPPGESAVVFSNQAAGVGNTPTSTTQFLTPSLVLNVMAGQKVFLVATRAFGAGATPAALLDLFPCYQSAVLGSPIVTQGSGILNLTASANSRHVYGLSYVITGLNTGLYYVGMCGDDDGNGNWTSNDYGYVSVVVLNN